MAVVVKYGSYTFDIAPFVSRSQEVLYDGLSKKGQVTAVELAGTILVDDGVYDAGFAGLNAKRNALISAFETDFQSLVVLEDSVEILRFDYCSVGSVSFEPSGNGIAAKYSISLKCYEQDLFARDYGILDPSDSVSYDINEDGTMSINHSVSARGIYTGYRKPIQNAIDWVDKRVPLVIDNPNDPSWEGGPSPFFTSGLNSSFDSSDIINSNLVLKNTNKNINRMDGSCSIEESYVLQTGDYWNAPLITGTHASISTSIKSGINDDHMTISVSYELMGGQNQTASSLRTAFNTISVTGTLYSIATGVDLGFSNLVGHNNVGNFPHIPESISIEDQADESRSIKLSCDFISNIDIINGNGYIFDPNFSINTDEINSETTVSIQGTIKGIGPKNYRYDVITGVHGSFSSIGGEYYKMCKEFYTGVYGASAWQLNPYPGSASVKENKFKGTVEISYSFNNKDIPVDAGGVPTVSSAGFTMNVHPSLKKYAAKPSINEVGLYSIYDLGVKTRENLDINTNISHLDWIDTDIVADLTLDHGIHDHFFSGYANGPVDNRGVTVLDSIKLNESTSVEGPPANSTSMNTKVTQKLQNQIGTPFNE